MSLWQSLLQLSVIHILMAMVPGPNTVIVSYFSAGVSRRAGLQTVAGITFASCAWVTLSLLGVGMILVEAGMIYRALRWLGAGYLVFVGVRMLWAAARTDAARSRRPGLSRRSPLAAGILTNISNPKSAVFWTSVFVVILPPHAPGWFLAATIAVATVQTAIWYSLVALFLSTPIARRTYAQFARWLDGLAGAIMTALGLRLAYEMRADLTARWS